MLSLFCEHCVHILCVLMTCFFVSPQTTTMSLYPSLEDMKVDQLGRVSSGWDVTEVDVLIMPALPEPVFSCGCSGR